MGKISHKCLKCQVEYFDEEVDDYYCPTCNEERKRIAKEIDAKIAMRPKIQHQSTFKPEDFIGRNGRKFFNAKDLGIKL